MRSHSTCSFHFYIYLCASCVKSGCFSSILCINALYIVMYCQVWWPILEIGPLHLTHPSAHTQQWVVNTHTVNTHPEAAIAPAPGEQLGVRCLAQGHLSRGIEGGESAVHSQSPPSTPAGVNPHPTFNPSNH